MPGPLDVIGDSDGGVLDDDLQRAALRALKVPRERSRARALSFDWESVCDQFISFLVPVESPPGLRPEPFAQTAPFSAQP